MDMEVVYMRKYKQVKRKEINFSMEEWAEVERHAAIMGVKTGTYLRRIATEGEVTFYNMKEATPLVNAMRTINNNINQIARRANETHSIHERDITEMRSEVESVCRVLNHFLASLGSERL